jgi:hypothetical protein
MMYMPDCIKCTIDLLEGTRCDPMIYSSRRDGAAVVCVDPIVCKMCFVVHVGILVFVYVNAYMYVFVHVSLHAYE